MPKRVEMYTLSERIWHWVQALVMILLILTGFQMHYPESFPLFGSMAFAVRFHSILAILLLVNAFLGFFYQLSTAGLRRYVPMPVDFTRGSWLQAKYYLFGIFKGDPHPYEKSQRQRLNPLQKVSYFALLNLLLPFQIATGVLCWGSTRWPETFATLGGLKVLATAHTLGAFFFVAFLIGHIYLTTTGHTLWSNMIAMITGHEEISDNE